MEHIENTIIINSFEGVRLGVIIVFYTIYKITNKINGKIYIGKHQTKDLNDDYMGSGKRLWLAIKKYSIENFEKEILFVFDNENDMNTKEAELVTEEFCLREDTYNLCPGGKGGFGYINENVLTSEDRKKAGQKGGLLNRNKKSPHFSKLVKALHKENVYNYNNFKDKKHTKETKLKIGSANSAHQTGNKNSQFGTIWITNGKESKKIRKDQSVPNGWYKGRIIKRGKES